MPYQQITSIEFQNPDRDTDNDISELAGNLKITQGGAIASSTLYTAYWGSTKDTFLTNFDKLGHSGLTRFNERRPEKDE